MTVDTEAARARRVPQAATTDLPRPQALRLQRPGWRDPRLLLGLTLVGGSVALGSWVVADAARTTPVLVARQDLVPGDRLTAEVVQTQDVRLPAVDHYLSPGEAADGVLVRTVRAGEVVPRAAVAQEADLEVRAVAVPVERPAPGVRPGAVVDLWFVPAPGPSGEAAADPHELVAGAVVAEVAEGGGAFAVGRGAAVHVLVPTDLLPAVLRSLAAAGTVELVPVAGGAG